MILEKVNEDKGNKRCEYTCPPVKIGIPIQSSCYQPDLMEGTNTQSSYFQRTRIKPPVCIDFFTVVYCLLSSRFG